MSETKVITYFSTVRTVPCFLLSLRWRLWRSNGSGSELGIQVLKTFSLEIQIYNREKTISKAASLTQSNLDLIVLLLEERVLSTGHLHTKR